MTAGFICSPCPIKFTVHNSTGHRSPVSYLVQILGVFRFDKKQWAVVYRLFKGQVFQKLRAFVQFTACSYKWQVKRNRLSLRHIRRTLLSYKFMDNFFVHQQNSEIKTLLWLLFCCIVVENDDRSRFECWQIVTTTRIFETLIVFEFGKTRPMLDTTSDIVVAIFSDKGGKVLIRYRQYSKCWKLDDTSFPAPFGQLFKMIHGIEKKMILADGKSPN